MRFEVTRRDVMKFAGGAAVGVALSPAPWKLLDDLSIWTQNGSWIPRLPRGPVTERATVCALCPAACPIRVRCVAGIPVQLAAASDAPLCPLGLTGHHLAYHPARLTAPARVRQADAGRLVIDRLPLPLAIDEIVGAVDAAREAGVAVAVLDTRPGRSVSQAWRQLLASLPSGVYVPNPSREDAGLAALTTSSDGVSPGVDLDAARTILSFGVPFAEGWGSPRNLRHLLDGGRNLIQVEPVRSRTAAIASLWLPVRPGTEAIVANAIRRGVRRASGAPEEDGVLALHSSAGIDHSLVEPVVELLVKGAPSIAIAGVDPGGGRLGPSTERAIASLNLTLDSIGAMGGLAARAELPSPLDDAPLAAARELDELPDWSVGLLIVDASSGDAAISWPAVRRKLSVGAIVVALTPFLAGTARHADLAIPTPAFLEAVGELPTPIDSPRARFALSAPILAAREGSVDPGSFIRMLAERTGSPLSGGWKTSEELMRVRVKRIHAMGRGRIVSPEADAEPASGISSPDQLWSTLVSGRWWEDDASAVAAIQWNVPDGLDASDATTSQLLTLVVQGPRDVTASAVASPVMTKLYQESKLRREANVVVMHPDTAREQGVRNGATTVLATEAGRIRVKVETDRSVRPGVVAATIAPSAASLGIGPDLERELVDICATDKHGSWRACPARLEV